MRTDQFGRSYSNDCPSVYRPDEDVDDGHGTEKTDSDADDSGRGN